MSPEDYAALLAEGKVTLSRDLDGNYLYDASKTTTAVLPRDNADNAAGRSDARQRQPADARHAPHLVIHLRPPVIHP
jgi:hypothetical protein